MSCLRLIGRLIALSIIFLFVVITPSLILAYNAQQTAVSGDFLDELFDDTEFFEAAIPEIAEGLAEDLDQNRETRDLAIAQLDASDWERVIYAVAPPETMQRWSQDAVRDFRRWVRRGGRFLDDYVLPFGELRDNIVNDPEDTVLRTLTQVQSACGDGEEPLSGLDDLLPDCQPPADGLEGFYQRLGRRWREQPREVWRQLMPDDLARYPDDTTLADFIEEESGKEWWEVRTNRRATRWGLQAARWLLAAFVAGQCVVALGLVALFAARDWREALRWVGTPLVLAGAFTLLLALFFFVGGVIGTWFLFDQEVPLAMERVFDDAARAFADDLWPPMAWQGGVLILIGLGMWVLSFFAPVDYELAAAPATAPPAPAVSETVEDAAPTEALPAESPPAASPETLQPEPSEDEPPEGEGALAAETDRGDEA